MTIRTALKREGLQEGLQKGLKKGQQKLEEVAMRLLGTGMQAAEVIQITELPKQRIAQLLDQLKRTTTRKPR
ncbi:MAG: hypothetical protein AAF310_05780 [Myxococcota bacterium]